MQTEIRGNPDYGELLVKLTPGETIRAVSGAMNWMSDDLPIRARLMGGLVRSVARKLLGGSSLFITEFSADRPEELSLAPTFPGAIQSVALENQRFFLSAGSFLAASDGIDLRTRFYGLKGFFSGSGAFLLEASGTGTVWFSAYGGLVEREISAPLVVDTGHVCAFEPSLDYSIRGMGGWKQTLFSGEGLTMHFSGEGKIFLQTRNVSATAGWITPFLRG